MKIAAFILIAIGIIARFAFLGQLPPGITHDEEELLLSAKSYPAQGQDISGSKFPASLVATNIQSKSTGVVSLVLAPIFGIVELNLISARIIFVLVNLATLLLAIKLIRLFVKDNLLSLIFLAVFCTNPWLIAYSRVTFAAPVALLSLVAGLYALFKNKGKKALWSTPLFILSAFSYLGALIATPAITAAALLLHARWNGRKQLRTNLLVVGILLASIAVFMVASKQVADSTLNNRSGEIALLNADRFASQVDIARRQSLAFPLSSIFINKYSSLFDELARKYFGAFSTKTLFFYGDPSAAHNFGSAGLLIPASALFVILGIIGAYKYNRKLLLLIAAIVAISPVGSVLSTIETSYFLRSFPLPLGLIMLISFGIYFAIKQSGKWHQLVGILVFALYSVLFLRFITFYFFQYPILEGESHFVSERVLVNYLIRDQAKIYAAVVDPYQIRNQYYFYAKVYDSAPPADKISLDNGRIVLSTNCPIATDQYDVLITDAKKNCLSEGNPVTIQNPKDAGVVYRIFGSKLCEGVELAPWRRENLTSDYNIEDMTTRQFCQRWITKSH